MNFKRKRIAWLVSNAFACVTLGSSSALVFAQDSASSERVIITGSAIKRTQTEGPVPVETITKAEITATGATTVNELLKSISTIDIYDQGELASNSPSGSGTGSVLMRGFDETAVLVLLNGRRLPVNALYDASGAGGAVDINMIPLSAIERIEILKDGGSAIYGADAVAGVVNFITKKNYNGLEAKVMYGNSSRGDGTEKQVSVFGGFGDLNKDNYNVLIAVDKFDRDPIFRKDRNISKSSDYRRLGGSDGRSSFSPYGNLVDSNTFLPTGATVAPCPSGLYNGRCRYDFNSSLLTAYNGADRLSAMLMGTLKISNSITGSIQYSHSESQDKFEAHPVPDYFVLPSGQYYMGRFMQGGPRISNRKAQMDYINFGLEGKAEKFDWDVVFGHGISKVTNSDRNYYNADLWYAALDSGAIDGTSLNNDPALVESLKVTPKREGTSKLTFLDGKISGEIMQLPNGPLGYAVGVSFWKESLEDNPDALTQAGLVAGSIQQAAVSASRNAKAIFGELSVPLPMNLEMQLAARYDSYPNASQTSPKAALSWSPTKSFKLRGSYSESFKVPRLKQLYGAMEQGAITLESAEECAVIGQPAGCGLPAYEVQGSNRDLKPEKGNTWNLGAAFDVGPLSGTIDWWKVHLNDAIGQPTILQALTDGNYGFDSTGRMLVYTNLQNFATVESSGIDLDGRLRFKNLGSGDLTIRNSTTYYLDINRKNGTGAEWEEVLNTYATPKVRNILRATYEMPNWSFTAAHKFVGSFYDTDAYPTKSDPMPSGTRKVKSFDQVDVAVAYKGWKDAVLTGGIQNVFDAMPPFSNQNASSNRYTQMGFAELYSSRGRFYYMTLEYKFK